MSFLYLSRRLHCHYYPVSHFVIVPKLTPTLQAPIVLFNVSMVRNVTCRGLNEDLFEEFAGRTAFDSQADKKGFLCAKSASPWDSNVIFKLIKMVPLYK